MIVLTFANYNNIHQYLLLTGIGHNVNITIMCVHLYALVFAAVMIN